MKSVILVFLMTITCAWAETNYEIRDAYYTNILCKTEDGTKLLHFQDYALYLLHSPDGSGDLHHIDNRSFTQDWVFVQPCYKNREAVFCGSIWKGLFMTTDIAEYEYFEDGTFVVKEGENLSHVYEYKNVKCVNPWY